MSNFGLELALRAAHIEFRRAQVGDRYVMGMLKESGGVLGGETSGHILCLDKTTTGDGLVSALQVLAVMKQTGNSLAELAAGMHRFPQVLLNVKVARGVDPTGIAVVQAAVARIEKRLNGEGRVVLRASPKLSSRALRAGAVLEVAPCVAPSSSEIGKCTAHAPRMRGSSRR